MSSAPNPYYFRRRTMGRAASPPTWACYEQIHDDDSNSDSDSCSEDDEDYNDHGAPPARQSSESDDNDVDVDAEGAGAGAGAGAVKAESQTGNVDSNDIDMDMDDDAGKKTDEAAPAEDVVLPKSKDVKGKQRAIDPEPETPKRQRKKREHVYALRPILTIQKSQGFVWNQDLFVPPYIKDRYIASTSPPNSRGFMPSSVSSTNSGMTDYEVEVVEIRVTPGEFNYFTP